MRLKKIFINLNIESLLYISRLLRPSRYELLKLTDENSYSISQTQSNFSNLVFEVLKFNLLAHPKLEP